MDFIKKNDFIVNQKKEKHFDRDLELFKEKCPNSKLNAELPRLNSFNRSKIHGLLLLDLLDKLSPEEILENRQKTTEPPPTGSDADATSGFAGKDQSAGMEGSGDEPDGVDPVKEADKEEEPEPAQNTEPVKKSGTSKTATVDTKTVLKKTSVTKPPVKKKGAKKKSSRK